MNKYAKVILLTIATSTLTGCDSGIKKSENYHVYIIDWKENLNEKNVKYIKNTFEDSMIKSLEYLLKNDKKSFIHQTVPNADEIDSILKDAKASKSDKETLKQLLKRIKTIDSEYANMQAYIKKHNLSVENIVMENIHAQFFVRKALVDTGKVSVKSPFLIFSSNGEYYWMRIIDNDGLSINKKWKTFERIGDIKLMTTENFIRRSESLQKLTKNKNGTYAFLKRPLHK